MVELYDFYLLFGFIEYVENRRGVFFYLLYFRIGDVDIFLFVEVLSSFRGEKIVEFVDVSFAFLISNSVSYQWLGARRLRVEYKEVEIIGIVFAIDDN